MSKRRRYKFREVLDMLVDEYSNSYPDIADSWLNSYEQVSETSQQDTVKIADSFHTHFDASYSQSSVQ